MPQTHSSKERVSFKRPWGGPKEKQVVTKELMSNTYRSKVTTQELNPWPAHTPPGTSPLDQTKTGSRLNIQWPGQTKPQGYRTLTTVRTRILRWSRPCQHTSSWLSRVDGIVYLTVHTVKESVFLVNYHDKSTHHKCWPTHRHGRQWTSFSEIKFGTWIPTMKR